MLDYYTGYRCDLATVGSEWKQVGAARVGRRCRAKEHGTCPCGAPTLCLSCHDHPACRLQYDQAVALPANKDYTARLLWLINRALTDLKDTGAPGLEGQGSGSLAGAGACQCQRGQRWPGCWATVAAARPPRHGAAAPRPPPHPPTHTPPPPTAHMLHLLALAGEVEALVAQYIAPEASCKSSGVS